MRGDDELIEKLTLLAAQFKIKLKKVLDNMESQNISHLEMASTMAEINFFKELQVDGLNLDIKQFLHSYNSQITDLMDIADKQGLSKAISINANAFDIIKNMDAETLLGKAFDFSNLLKKGLVDGLIGGKPIPKILKDLEPINLTNTQLNTVVHTAYDDFGRTVTALAYQDEPNQKFLYGEGRELGDPTSRATCQAALLAQLESYPDGVTRAQVDEGIYPEIDFIRGGGYNCSHRFYPATPSLIKRQTEKSKKGLDSERGN